MSASKQQDVLAQFKVAGGREGEAELAGRSTPHRPALFPPSPSPCREGSRRNTAAGGHNCCRRGSGRAHTVPFQSPCSQHLCYAQAPGRRLLVATTAAEEGLDVPCCEFVVRFR